MKTIATILLLLALLLPARAQKVSEMPATFTINQSDLIMVTVPGVNNYKSTFISFATNLNPLLTISASTTNAVLSGSNMAVTNATTFGVFYDVSSITNMRFFSLKQGTNIVLYRDGSNIVINAIDTGGGGAASITTNANQFGASTTITIKDGALVTNLTIYGSAALPGITALRPAFINANGVITNTSGTPDGTKFVRDDGVLAVPGGGGDVTTAQLNTSSNAIISIVVANDTTTSNGLFSTETTRNAAVSNAVVTLLVANDTTTSNGLFSVETTRNAAVSNALVTYSLALPRTNLDVYVKLTTYGDSMVASNMWVTQTITAARTDVVDANISTIVLTNALGSNQVRMAWQDMTNYSFNPFIISGVGGANTNFTLQAGQPEVIVNAFTNVSLRAIMGGSATKIDYIRVTMTNGSGGDKTLEFSPVTNSFRFAGIYGTNAPSVITNQTQLHATLRVSSSNVLVKYDYYPWP